MTVSDHPTHLPDPLQSQRVRSFLEPAMRTIANAKSFIDHCALVAVHLAKRAVVVALCADRGAAQQITIPQWCLVPILAQNVHLTHHSRLRCAGGET